MTAEPPAPPAEPMTLYGRSSSHFTRLARIFALEAAVELRFHPVADMTSLSFDDYGGHPGLKMPLLRIGEDAVFGAENICRRLALAATNDLSVTWTEHLRWLDLRNAQELVWQAMAAQTQLVFGLQLAGLPADNVYFAKARVGLSAILDWLEARLPRLLRRLPKRDLSLFEASLFCLLTHIAFRGGADGAVRPHLQSFMDRFGLRSSASATAYAFDRV